MDSAPIYLEKTLEGGTVTTDEKLEAFIQEFREFKLSTSVQMGTMGLTLNQVKWFAGAGILTLLGLFSAVLLIQIKDLYSAKGQILDQLQQQNMTQPQPPSRKPGGGMYQNR